uniref:Uncharacterized protein n=1 Tax=Varanus komodoensis TaxID=61221 RepID=A0A8D2IV78_VARKO
HLGWGSTQTQHLFIHMNVELKLDLVIAERIILSGQGNVLYSHTLCELLRENMVGINRSSRQNSRGIYPFPFSLPLLPGPGGEAGEQSGCNGATEEQIHEPL